MMARRIFLVVKKVSPLLRSPAPRISPWRGNKRTFIFFCFPIFVLVLACLVPVSSNCLLSVCQSVCLFTISYRFVFLISFFMSLSLSSALLLLVLSLSLPIVHYPSVCLFTILQIRFPFFLSVSFSVFVLVLVCLVTVSSNCLLSVCQSVCLFTISYRSVFLISSALLLLVLSLTLPIVHCPSSVFLPSFTSVLLISVFFSVFGLF